MISIVIPTYEMGGHGVGMLNELFISIQKQAYKNFEVIVTDDSGSEEFQDLCFKFDAKYYKNNGEGGACSNLNNGLIHAKGSIIKPMFQDDQFLDTDALDKVAAMKGQWCVLTSAHTSDRGDHVPYENKDVYELARGCNTFGSPSAVAWRRWAGMSSPGITELFDENLKWLFDVDFYARMVIVHGQPEFIDSKVLIREWDGMATRTIADGGVRIAELAYIESKFTNLRP